MILAMNYEDRLAVPDDRARSGLSELLHAPVLAIPNCNIPGLGKVDRKAYLSSDNAVMTEKNWWHFARFVANRNMDCLKTIFNLAKPRASL